MRYMLLIGNTEKHAAPPSRAEGEALLQGHARFSEELRAAGKAIASDRLRGEDEASRVYNKAGHRHVTDGPFAETKEAIGGFYVIECASKDEAVEWAKKIPLRDGGFVDVRPVWQM